MDALIRLARCALLLLPIVTAAPAVAAAPERSRAYRPALVIEATYPGASAQIVADTVAAPLEQKLLGVDPLAALRSQCRADGTYRLLAIVKERGDLDPAKTIAQKRIGSALAGLPEAVRQRGITVRAASPGVSLVCVLSSPEGTFNEVYLSNYALIQIRDQLTEQVGVASVQVVGDVHYGVRVFPDLEKLAVHDLTIGELADALKQATAVKKPVERGNGSPEPKAPGAVATLASADELSSVIVKTSTNGRLIYLRDVARIETGAVPASQAVLHGKPAVALVVSPLPQASAKQVAAACRAELTRLGDNLPQGLKLETPFDFSDSPALGAGVKEQLLLVAITPPLATSDERAMRLLDRCSRLVEHLDGIQTVVALSQSPFGGLPGGHCLLVRFSAGKSGTLDHDALKTKVRSALVREIPGAAIAVCDVSVDNGLATARYQLDGAVVGPNSSQVNRLAGKLSERLRAGGAVTDLSADDSARSQLDAQIDREKLKQLGIKLSLIDDVIQAATASLAVGEVTELGRPVLVSIEAEPNVQRSAEALGRVMIRAADGRQVPLSSVAEFRQAVGLAVLKRLDGQSMAELTANPEPGMSVEDAQRRIMAAFEQTRAEEKVSSSYQFRWLAE